MKRILPLLIAGLLFLHFSNRVSFSEEPANQNSEVISPKLLQYSPLKVDRWWQYDRSYWSIVYGSAWVEEITATVVGEDVVLGDKQAYIIKETGVSYDSIWVVYAGDEIRRYEDFPRDYSDYKVLLKLPLEQGQRWAYSPFPVARDTVWAHVLDTDALVEVSAGEFGRCVYIYVHPFKHFWYAPELGLIKSSEAEPDSVTGTDNDLMNYQVE